MKMIQKIEGIQNETNKSFFLMYKDVQNIISKAYAIKTDDIFFVVKNNVKTHFDSFIALKQFIYTDWGVSNEEREKQLGVSMYDFLELSI